MEIPKVYSPEETERPWYPFWENHGYFKPRPDGSSAYSLVIPPPNVTGSLHMGHALNNTLQDILTRWHRMQGDRTVWAPGTDHGGIATQNVVEKLLRAEKKTRNDLGREAFLERMWQWRKESGDTILMQLKRLGASCDWSRTRFTMDEPYSLAVRTAFVKLYEKGLIYRGPRMVNWCPRCQTALSDIEVEHEERAGKLWHIRYPATDGAGAIVVATTRPETLLGDTAVAVNPKDDRYKKWQGKALRLPLMNRDIPVITDDAVEAGFGTGAVKVTPAHDPTDFEIGERHKLPHVVVIGFDGKMTDKAGPYAGLDRMEARKRIVEDLEKQGLLEKTEDYKLSVAVCYRCGTIIEPLVSEQWFMQMKGMADRAAEATRTGKVKIFPASWEKPYLSWLDNIRDWCISRQIWWGHRIPVWYCPNSLSSPAGSPPVAAGNDGKGRCKPIASIEPPAKCPQCGSGELKQDEDVLDTWFSSGLWPLVVFGWPNETADLKTFYPTSVLVTGHEILYLWVARMVMMGLEFRNDIPFHHVYIHGIVRDKQGKKMSKSLGNVIDPLDIMKQYGTDALRFSLASSSIPGRDMQLSNDAFLKARNFANKLWNASRFILMNLEGYKPGSGTKPTAIADRWILHSLNETIAAVQDAFANYNPAEASRRLYEFAWDSYCDWYLEISKIALTDTASPQRQAKQELLIRVLDQTLKLLHPIMPYETEQLFQALKPYLPDAAESIMISPWPRPKPEWTDDESARQFRRLQNMVTAIRTVRSEMNIPPGTKIECLVKCEDDAWTKLLQIPEAVAAIHFLGRVNSFDVNKTQTRPANSAFTVFDGGEIYIPLTGLIDKEKERARLEKEIRSLDADTAKLEAQLTNKNFMTHAPAEEIENRKAKLAEVRQKITSIKKNLEGLA